MGSISVLCYDSDCEARWIGAVDNSDLFVCKCVPEKGGILAFKDLKELEEYFRKMKISLSEIQITPMRKIVLKILELSNVMGTNAERSMAMGLVFIANHVTII